LAFVGQISAGYGHVPGRLLYIFACQRAECSDKPVAWKILRSMASPPASKPSAEVVPNKDQSCAGPTTATVPGPALSEQSIVEADWGIASSQACDDWGAPQNDDWGVAARSDDWSALPAGRDAFEGIAGSPSADAEIESLLLARDIAPKAVKVRSTKKAVAEEEVDLGRYLGTCQPCNAAEVWPCVAVEIYCEPDAEAAAGEHERELYERYLSGEEAKDDDHSLGPDSTLPAELDVDDKKEICLEMEADELDVNLDEEDWFARFQQRLERSPSQVIRYSWGGAPLWLSRPPDQLLKGAWPPPCGRCGAARSFELQLLPTISYQLQESCPTCPVEGKMDWGTAAVYTCSQDCAADDFCEEFVIVQPAV
jgi:pre-rRNA-processing protein TSR4